MTRILIAVVVALSLGNWWQRHVISNLKLEQKDERIARDRANRVDAERRIAAHRAAELQAQDAIRVAAADRERTDVVGSGLRDTTAALRAGNGDPATCVANAEALTVVFDDCQSAYADMAGQAQGWYIEAVKQHDAAQ